MQIKLKLAEFELAATVSENDHVGLALLQNVINRIPKETPTWEFPKKLQAIKTIREHTRLGLAEAKYLVEEIQRNQQSGVNGTPF